MRNLTHKRVLTALRACVLRAPIFYGSLIRKTGAAPPYPVHRNFAAPLFFGKQNLRTNEEVFRKD